MRWFGVFHPFYSIESRFKVEVKGVMVIPRDMWGQWPLITRFEIITIKPNNQNVFVRHLGMYWFVKNRFSSVGSHLNGISADWPISVDKHCLRSHRLTQGWNWGSSGASRHGQHARLLSSSFISLAAERQEGSFCPPPPADKVVNRPALSRVDINSKCAFKYLLMSYGNCFFF